MHDENDEDEAEAPESDRFPLSREQISERAKLLRFVRSHLPAMAPADLRSAAAVLLALERLPASTPGHPGNTRIRAA